MNNAPLPLAITLMDFDKFMLSVTNLGTALPPHLFIMKIDKQHVQQWTQIFSQTVRGMYIYGTNAQVFLLYPVAFASGLNHSEGVEAL